MIYCSGYTQNMCTRSWILAIRRDLIFTIHKTGEWQNGAEHKKLVKCNGIAFVKTEIENEKKNVISLAFNQVPIQNSKIILMCHIKGSDSIFAIKIEIKKNVIRTIVQQTLTSNINKFILFLNSFKKGRKQKEK